MSAAVATANPRLEAALRLAAQGLRVYPAHSVADGLCTCGCNEPSCKTRGKHPHITEWQKKATTDPRQIRAWWHKWPDANIGIATGRGKVVVEGDTGDGKDGPGYMHAHPELFPETVTQLTPSGSEHRMYLVPLDRPVKNDVNRRIGHGCDIRGDGGYIIAAPSTHRSGGVYAWVGGHAPGEIEIAEAPAALLDLLAPPEPPPAVSTAVAVPVEASDELAERILVKYLGQAGSGRNSAGYEMACQLRDNGFSQWDAETVMLRYQSQAPAGDHPYTKEEALASLASAYSHTAREPWHSRAVITEEEPAPATPLQDATVPDGLTQRLTEAIEAYAAGNVGSVDLVALLAEASEALKVERAARLLAEARVMELEAEIAQAEALKLNKGLNKGAREVYQATRKVLAEAGGAPGVEVHLPLAQVGAIALQSKSTVKRHLDHFERAGLITSRTATQNITRYIPAPEGSGRKWQEITRKEQIRYITPTAAFLDPATVFSDKRHGGARSCSECGSEDVEVKTVRYCRCRSCGHNWREGAEPATPLHLATVSDESAESSENGTLCDHISDTFQNGALDPTPLISQGRADYVPPWERTVERKEAAATRLNVARYSYSDAPAPERAANGRQTGVSHPVKQSGSEPDEAPDLPLGEWAGAPLPEYGGDIAPEEPPAVDFYPWDEDYLSPANIADGNAFMAARPPGRVEMRVPA